MRIIFIFLFFIYSGHLKAKKYDASVVDQRTGPVVANDLNQRVIRVGLNVINGGGTPTCSGMRFDLSNFTDVLSAELHYTAQDPTYTSPTMLDSTSTFTSNVVAFTYTAVDNSSNNGYWYYWLVINMKSSITADVQIDASYKDGTYGTTPTFASSNPVGFKYSGTTYSIGPGGDFTTFALAVDDIVNADFDQTANINYEFNGSYTGSENQTISITESYKRAGNITIQPASGISGVELKGDPGLGNHFIELSGISNITFDGRPAGAGSNTELTIRNTRTGTTGDVGATLWLEEGASNNTFTYLNLEGEQTVTASPLNGIVVIATDVTNTGNNQNTFDYCHIRDIQVAGSSNITDLPNSGIVSEGTAGRENTENTITNCHFYDIFSEDEDGGGGNIRSESNTELWNISNNHIYQTVASYTSTVEQVYKFMNIITDSTNVFNGNYIGGQSDSCGGSPMVMIGSHRFTMMETGLSTSDELDIVTNNVISNIDLTTTYNASDDYIFNGLFSNGKSIVDSNIIGQGVAEILITYNVGVNPAKGFQALNVNNNDTNWVRANQVGGIRLNGTGDPGSSLCMNLIGNVAYVDDNVIGTDTIAVQQHSSLLGINLFGSFGNQFINRNMIKNLGITNGGTTGSLTGMFLFQSQAYVYNNIILLDNLSGLNALTVRGIWNSSGFFSLCHNTIKISGTSAGSTFSYCHHFFNFAPSNSGSANNIFQNTRTGGTAGNYAIRVDAGTTYSGDYNYMEVTENTAKTGDWGGVDKTLAGWQAAQPGGAGETNSITGTTTIDAVGGAGATFVGASNGIDLTGTVTDDKDKTTRVAPVWRGAYEGATSILLPIELSGFSVACTDNMAEISWTTLSETNNDYFVIERSIDAWNFEEIVHLEGSGNSNVSIDYTTFDKDPYPIGYYRLKQVDYDGKFSYSNIVYSLCTSKGQVKSFSVYPNPMKDFLIIESHDTNKEYSLSIYNEVGVQQTEITHCKGDKKVNLPSKASGMYYLVIRDSTRSYFKKVMVSN